MKSHELTSPSRLGLMKKTLLTTTCTMLGWLGMMNARTGTAEPVDVGGLHWIVRAGVGLVRPKPHSGPLAGMESTVNNKTRPTISIEYLLTPHWGFDLLAAQPFRHSVKLNGQRAVSVRQLPPTLGFLYHFLPGSRFSPFAGAGVTFTDFFDASGRGTLAGSHVHMSNSWGPSVHAGLDYNFSRQWLLTADIRWSGITSTVRVNGVRAGRAMINPLVIGLSVGYRF